MVHGPSCLNARALTLEARSRITVGRHNGAQPMENVGIARTWLVRDVRVAHDMLDSNTAKGLIKPHMPVVCSEDGQFATVDHIEGTDQIKLSKDKSGKHHFIPLTWVTTVDDKVHIDRPGAQAMKEWKTEPS